VALVGEGVPAGVPQHVRVGLQLQAGAGGGAPDHAGEAGCGERGAALADEDERRNRALAPEPAKGAELVALYEQCESEETAVSQIAATARVPVSCAGARRERALALEVRTVHRGAGRPSRRWTVPSQSPWESRVRAARSVGRSVRKSKRHKNDIPPQRFWLVANVVCPCHGT
jgi:hypothetical protein